MKTRKNKTPKTRNLVVLGMIINTKHAVFHDRRAERGGSKNRQVKYLSGDY